MRGFETHVHSIGIEYVLNDKVFIFNQQNNAAGTSRGTLYDTDDTVVKDLIINGSPAILLVNRHGTCTLNWQSKNLVLQITGYVTEDDIIKIGNSIK